MKDEELIYAFLRGDQYALETLIKEYMGPIYNYIYYLVGNAGDAEDITQDVFVSAWKNIERFDRTKKFKTWIFAIAKNASFNWLKKKKPKLFSDVPVSNERDEPENFIETIADDSPLPEELFTRADLGLQLSKAIDALNPIYRSILLLHYKEELSLQEIAELENESINTIKSKHRRALMQLKKNFDY